MTDKRDHFEDEVGLLAAEYVLGVLRAEDRAAFAGRIAREPRVAEAVKFWDEHFASLANEIAPVTAHPRVISKIEERLFGKEQPKASLWNSLGFWRGLATAAIVGAVVLGGYNFYRPTQQSGEALVAQVQGNQGAVKLVAFYDSAKGELRLNRTEGAPAPGRALELWLIAGNDAPVSLGVLPAANTDTISVPANIRAKFKNGVLAISDEPPGGSITGAPTGAVLATGKLTTI